MNNYDNYIDPNFLEQMTYIDKNGVRRVKNPYQNRQVYEVLVNKHNARGNFVIEIPGGVLGKSVYVEYPSGTHYPFIVSAATNELTIIGIPLLTLAVVNVVDPKPFPPSDKDLIWDNLGYDAQKAIVAAWGDIDLVCNVLYPSTVESELDFDDQNTIKYGLVGWKNNCGNVRSTDWSRPKAPPNGIYFPPQPEPTDPPDPPGPDPIDPEIGHPYDLKFVLRWEDDTRTDVDMYAYLGNSRNRMVYYGHKEYYQSDNNQMWLDKDYVIHGPNGRTNAPEIVTVLGFKNFNISIQLNNFNAGFLTEDVTLEVRKEDQTLLKEYVIPYSYLSGGPKNFWVCDVDLSTNRIIDKMRPISKVGTFN